jgi:very-short-patch-repair endonuclease
VTATDKAYKNARGLRRNLSLPETLLWARLRRSGVRFRRQHPLGPYVLDFYCAARKLAIKVDGFAHDAGDRPGRDALRTDWLQEQGIDVLRIPAKDVLADPDSVADALIRLCARPLHHSVAPSGPPPQPAAREEPDDATNAPPCAAEVGRGTAADGGGGGVSQ